MKNIILIILLFIAVTSKAQCPNGDVEQGNWSSFNRLQGLYTDPINYMSLNPTPVQSGTPLWPRQEVISTPTGPHSVNDISAPAITISDEGFYCIRVNNRGALRQKDAVYYTFNVTNANKYFKFKYAVVLEDPGHVQNKQPFAEIFMNLIYTNGCGFYNGPHYPPPPMGFGFCSFNIERQLDWNLFNSTYIKKSANSSDPYFKKGPGEVVYKNWQCVEYDLSAYVGRTVTLCVIAAACDMGAHYGYIYLDGLCKPNIATSSFTLNNNTLSCNSQLIMNGANSEGEDRYFIGIAECDASGNLIPGGQDISWWTLGEEVPNSINISNEFVSHGGTWKCNTFYKIKLAVMSDCAPWNETSQIIKYTCPDIEQPPNQTACCPKAGTNCFNLTVSNPNPNYTYNWQSTTPTGYNFTGTNVQWCSNSSNIFSLTATDNATGCKAVTTSTVYVNGNFNASLSIPDVNHSCGSSNGCKNPPVTLSYTTTACSPQQSSAFNSWMQNSVAVTWGSYPFFTALQQGGTSFSPPSSGNYGAVVGNGCNVQILPFSAVVKDLYTPSLLAPNSFTPYSGIPGTQTFQIIDYGLNVPNLGVGPAYGTAIDFELRIFDRWGVNFRTITKADVGLGPDDCLKNGDIYWDGKNNNGNLVQQDVYIYCLSLKLCDGSMIPWKINSDNGIGCISYCYKIDKHWPFIHKYCCVSCGYAYKVSLIQ